MIPGIDARGALYPIEKLRAHREAVFHLAVSVFVFDGERLLIQQRAAGKYHSGGLWANTCCTHPHWEEAPKVCAERRLQEELGFTLPLSARPVVEYRAEVGNGLVEHERVSLFVGHAAEKDIDLDPDPEEVSAARWVTRNELEREIAEAPERFTPWFRIYLERYPGFIY